MHCWLTEQKSFILAGLKLDTKNWMKNVWQDSNQKLLCFTLCCWCSKIYVNLRFTKLKTLLSLSLTGTFIIKNSARRLEEKSVIVELGESHPWCSFCGVTLGFNSSVVTVIFKIWQCATNLITQLWQVLYSEHLKTAHSNTRNIKFPDKLTSGCWMTYPFDFKSTS